MLGIELLEDAQEHLRKSKADVVKPLKEEAAGIDLVDAIGREQDCVDQIEIHEAELSDLECELASVTKCCRRRMMRKTTFSLPEVEIGNASRRQYTIRSKGSLN